MRPLASALYDEAQCKFLILKLSERGVLACRSADHEALDSFFVVDTFAEHVVDAVGAGDALLAYATLAILTSGNEAVATILGNIAAGCKCEVDGNVPVTPENVHAKIDAVEKQVNYAA